jgi:hypothetical protein
MAYFDIGVPYDPDMVLSFDLMPLGSSVPYGAGVRGNEWAAKTQVIIECQDGMQQNLMFGYNDDGGPTYTQYAGSNGGVLVTVVGHPDSPLGVWQRDQQFRLGDYVDCAGTLTQVWMGGAGWTFEGRGDNLRLEIPG